MPKLADSQLWMWGCKAVEAWPAMRAKFQAAMDSPWEAKTIIGKAGETGERAERAGQSIFQFLFGPGTFYRSAIGKSLLTAAADGKDLGLLGADAQTKVNNANFIQKFSRFLQLIDPLWEHEKPGMKTYRQDIADVFGDYLRGKVKTEDLPVEWRNDGAELKQHLVDLYNGTPELKKLNPAGKKGEWVLDDDIMSKTINDTMFNKNTMNMGQYGLTRLVPKEIPYRIVKAGSADGVSAVDWLRAAGPMLNRKNQFDPVIERMIQAMPQMDELEARYTQRLIDRLTGKPTSMQRVIDGMVDNVRMAFGLPKMQISASAQFAAGMSKMFYDGIMLYNPGMAILNMTQTLNTLAKEGEMTTLAGIKNFFTEQGRELAAENKFLGDLDLSFYRNYQRSLEGKAFAKFESAGYYLFDKAEHYNRGIAFHAGLVRYMRDEKIGSLDEFLALRTGGEAERAIFAKGMLTGVETANETQFLYGVVHQSPFLATPLAKLVAGQFLSFPLRQSEFMLKHLRQGDWAFFARFMAYTGIASSAAYYGLGIAAGENLGGGGSVPEALELLKSGDVTNAIHAGVIGTIKFMPEMQSLAQGVTPFGNLVVNGGAALADTLGILSSDNPEQKWQKVGRSMSLAIPAGLEMRRLLESSMVQFAQQGQRYRPQGLAEGLSIPVAMSLAAKKVFGTEIPGVSTRYTGSLQRTETPGDSIKAALGLRGANIEMESRIMDISKGENQQTKQGMSDLSARIANALIDNADPAEFSAAMEDAVNSGLFADPQSLNQSIENAMAQRTQPDLQRLQSRSPKVLKLKRAINAP